MASVLVIEDDQRIRETIARSLADDGHSVRTEGRGADALERRRRLAPDVVVLDLGLPDIDGTDVLRMVRSVSEVPVIVATARDDDAEIVRVLDAGADDYIVKPYSAAQLDARIRAVLRRTAGPGDEAGAAIAVGGAASSIPIGARRRWRAVPSSCPVSSSTCWPTWPGGRPRW